MSRRLLSLVFSRRASSQPARPDQEIHDARQWLSALSPESIPRLGQVSFSRASGPGGQNATLKVPLQDLLPLVPRLLHPVLRASRYATDRSQSLVIQSDESRKQAANVDSCYDKLYELLQSMAHEVIPGETSPEQRHRVQKLQRAQNEARIKNKKLHSSKKSSRRGKHDD
ncbi:hypothetical protein N7510_011386 [Penicillium lagena]|uniref:uncharacterized protein n=1 Tax=Penicillium lagena TaxID=94218 RepID=UPI0025417611|nr:uncharacterized protein N7510_011386 [Penicillium lagena]KAJ5601852.1 hypothetical protein N7510_011386 [Penicillium lagena]